MSEQMRALEWAMEVHRGQLYRRPDGDWPYVFHLVRVASRVPADRRIAALLHDCLEDGGQLPPWIGPDDRAAVETITRREDETYAEYIERVRNAVGPAGEIARVVKIADLEENLGNGPPREDQANRYREALAKLSTVGK